MADLQRIHLALRDIIGDRLLTWNLTMLTETETGVTMTTYALPGETVQRPAAPVDEQEPTP